MKKNNIIKAIGTIAIGATGIAPIVSCGSKHDFKIVKDYLVELPTYKTLDYEYAQDFFKHNPIKAGACSAVVKDVGNKELLVGRNMDFAFSKKCAYIIRTDEKDKYKTLGFAYATAEVSPDFSVVKKKGINDEWYKIAPFFCTDVINEKGLYCEIDMRNIEKDDKGKSIFRCSGTNQDSDIDVHMVALTRFIVNNCKDVPEALKFVREKINVYNKEEDWNFSFILADASGNYGLLEFGHNDIYWKAGQNMQTNYFLNGDLATESKIKFGIGRKLYLEEHLSDVTDSWSMFNLINQLSYSNVYKGRYCPFDMRSEASDLITDVDYEWLMPWDEEHKEEVYKRVDVLIKQLEGMTEEEKRQLSWYWQSTFTEVVDIAKRSIHIRMFEDKNYIFDFKV